MNILYEEDGNFKVGNVMTDNTTSFQIESVSGKRSKVKAANVMLRFTQPALAEFIAQAESIASGIEVDFLWECCPADEFGFEQIATEYFGHIPSLLEAAAALIRLHSAPLYFHKKGKGRYRAAAPGGLKAALAGAERKRQQLALQARYTEQLSRFELPGEFTEHLPQLLYKPDRNTIEVKALEAACAATHLSCLLYSFTPIGSGALNCPLSSPITCRSCSTNRIATPLRSRLWKRLARQRIYPPLICCIAAARCRPYRITICSFFCLSISPKARTFRLSN